MEPDEYYAPAYLDEDDIWDWVESDSDESYDDWYDSTYGD